MRKITFFLTLLLGCGSLLSQDKNVVSNFTSGQIELIQDGDSLSPMPVFLITNYMDSLLLRQQSRDVEVDPDDPILKLFVKRLYHTVTDSASLGVGIAAPQVGILKNIIWVQRLDKKEMPFEVYLNPKIIQYTDKKQACPEGCLSIPGVRDTTQNRAYAILLKYDKMDGSHRTEMVEGFTAVIFQHEIDHLNGILFIDHLRKEVAEARKR